MKFQSVVSRLCIVVVALAVLLAPTITGRAAENGALDTGSSVVQSGGLLLARGGQALLPVIISPRASEATQKVAAELAEYLGRVTGAKFKVKTGDGATGIVLGTLAEFPNPQLNKPLEIRDTYDGREAYSIRTEANRVLLIGATELGASHAAYRFLESLGVRWIFPGKEWEVVPSLPALQVKINEDGRPAILSRRIWYGYGLFDRTAREMYNDWMRRNRMAASLEASAGHSWESIVRRNEEFFKQHPDYFALVPQKDGTLKRQGAMLDIGKPEVRKFITEWALERFRQNPDIAMVSIGPADGLYKNESPEAKAYGATVSDQMYRYVNEVARAVSKEFPGKMVGILAYSNYADPPSFPLEPNVYIQLTRGFNYGTLTFDELLEQWPKKAKNWGLYEYYSVHISDYDMLPGGGGANVANIRTRIPYYAELGAISFSGESSNNWGPNGRGYYLANRLMWNPKADADAVLNDFYEKAFGPAAAVMQRYYDRYNPSTPGSARPVMTGHLIGLGFRDLDEASRLAKDRPDVQARLDHLKQYMYYVYLYWTMRRERDKAKGRDIQLEIFKHGYRTRYSNMLHWMPMQRHWSVRAARQFEEPSWALGAPEPRPWVGTPPYTREETEQRFQEGLKYFEVKTGIEEKEYSDDLVPVRFGDAPAGAPANQQAYRGGMRYDFYSVRGEPLELEITPGWIREESGLREKTTFAYKVTDADENPVAEGEFDTAKKPRPLSIKVPRAGLYQVSFSDMGTGFAISTPPSQPVAIPLNTGRSLNTKLRVPLYFYVPKGTKQINYTFDGAPHRVLDPTGNVQAQAGKGQMVTVPVPRDMDGKVWSIAPWLAGSLQFTNLPQVLSTSPHLMLLPREVAENDRLEILTK